MTPDVTLDHLVVRAIRQYQEKTVCREGEKAGGNKESAPHPQGSYSLSGLAQSCLGCELFRSEECGVVPRPESKKIPAIPCRDRQVLILMAKRTIASL